MNAAAPKTPTLKVVGITKTGKLVSAEARSARKYAVVAEFSVSSFISAPIEGKFSAIVHAGNLLGTWNEDSLTGFTQL